MLRPKLDEYADQPNLLPGTDAILNQKGVEQFLETAEGKEYLANYASSENNDRLLDWTIRECVPSSKRNLQLAFRELVETGQMKMPDGERADLVVIHTAQVFAAENPSYDGYFSTANLQKVEQYMAAHHITLSVEGLKEAFDALIGTQQIRPMTKGFPIFRKMNEAERQFAIEERRKAELLSPAGQKPNAALKQAYQQSLKGSPAQTRDYAIRVRDARAAVSNANPDMDVWSREFQHKVSEHLASQQD